MKRALVFPAAALLLAAADLGSWTHVTAPPSKWGGPPVPSASGNVHFAFHADGTPDHDAEFDLLRESLLAWESATLGGCDLEFDGLTLLPPSTGDGVNVIGWTESGGTPGIAAIATYAFGASQTIVEGDVEFNGDGLAWDDSDRLLNVALHEVGHTLGLGHTDDETAVMWPDISGLTDLQQDDVEGIRALYGLGAGVDGIGGPAVPDAGTDDDDGGSAPSEDDDDGRSLRDRCVVATAAWGAPGHASVAGLRAFRDRTLRGTEPGKRFADLYRQSAGGSARVVGRTEVLRALVRAWLP